MSYLEGLNIENVVLPKDIRGDKFYKLLEWLQVCQEFKKYLCTSADYIFGADDFKETNFRLFSDFVDYAMSGVCTGLLGSNSSKKYKFINKPNHAIELVWDNLKNYLLDDTKEKTEMSQVVLGFLDDFAVRNNVQNPYNMTDAQKMMTYKERMSKESAWELLKEGDEYKKRLINGSTISDEIDAILGKYDISLVFTNYGVKDSDIKTFDDIYFLYDVDGEKKHFSLLTNRQQLKKDFLTLQLGISSLQSTTGNTSWNAPSSNPSSLVSQYPYLVDVVVNLEDEANMIKRCVNPNAKINKTKRLVDSSTKITG